MPLLQSARYQFSYEIPIKTHVSASKHFEDGDIRCAKLADCHNNENALSPVCNNLAANSTVLKNLSI
jgi:hypothetical protein